jgi:hypothetical protein
MSKNRWIAISLLAIVPACGVLALGQYAVPDPPKLPQFSPQAPPLPVENIAVTELRIGLQKAQIQSTLAERVAQVKEDGLRAVQSKASMATVDQETLLNAQTDAIGARAAADSARVDVAIMDTQFRAGPAALQQAQAASQQQQGGGIPQASPLMAQLMQSDLKKVQIQAAAAAQIVPVKQKLYDLLVAHQKAGTATADKVTDAMLDLEAAKVGQQIAAMDEQLMIARLTASGVRR